MAELTTEIINENLPDNNIRAINPEKIRQLFEAAKADITAGAFVDLGPLEAAVSALQSDLTALDGELTTLSNRTPNYWMSGATLISASSTFTMIHTLNTTQVFAQFMVDNIVNNPDIRVKVMDYQTIQIVNTTASDVTGILRVIGFN